MSPLAQSLMSLPYSERLRLAMQLWDSIAAEPEKLPLSENNQKGTAGFVRRVSPHWYDKERFVDKRELMLDKKNKTCMIAGSTDYTLIYTCRNN